MSAPASPRGIVRDVILIAVGALVGAGVASGAFLAFDDDDNDEPAATQDAAQTIDPTADPAVPSETRPTIDPTETEFGELTDQGDGVKVQWASELAVGSEPETGEFVTAHRAGQFVLEHDNIRIVEAGEAVTLCQDGSCSASSPEDAASALPETVQPFYRIVRLVEQTTASDQYQITGETELASGIFQRCGQFDPEAFGIVLPGDVQLVTQCVDVDRNVPMAIDLVGTQRSLGTASLTAIADADASAFETG